MIRNVLVRNAISFLLFVIAVVGIVTQVNLIRHGIIEPQTRLTLAAYIIIAIYAAASIVVRLRAGAPKK